MDPFRTVNFHFGFHPFSLFDLCALLISAYHLLISILAFFLLKVTERYMLISSTRAIHSSDIQRIHAIHSQQVPPAQLFNDQDMIANEIYGNKGVAEGSNKNRHYSSLLIKGRSNIKVRVPTDQALSFLRRWSLSLLQE